jgi:2-polyprenyl-3-methyl-5-hydroxy-6-metoxy-1,4-benzoquinol methylase
MSIDHFNSKARTWDNDKEKFERARIIATKLIQVLKPNNHLTALEFGCGTGLLGFQLTQVFKEITLIDTAQEMIEVVKDKIIKQQITNVTPLCGDIFKHHQQALKTDVIFTLMTLHHIKEIEKLIPLFYTLLHPNGYVCIADLVEEDGTFHPKEQHFDGHFGFNKNQLEQLLLNNGFQIAHYSIPYTIEKKETSKKYPVFLLIAKKVPN